MLFRSEVTFPVFGVVQDEVGNEIQQEVSSRAVMANEKSVRSSEFYQAAGTQHRPEIVFEVRSVEYAGESLLRHEGTEYNIIRTFSNNREIVELICERVIHK